MFEKYYRPALLILLTLIMIIQAVGLFMEQSRSAQCAQATKTLASQIKLLSDHYQGDVYNNSQVDNINKQLLINNEYQFQSQQLTAQLLAACQ